MNIKFASKEAYERYHRCALATAGMRKSLDSCIASLMKWGYEGEIIIKNDFDSESFTFTEVLEDGNFGCNGGIILHGPRDGFGSGAYPTFSVSATTEPGYEIHT